MSSSLSVKQWIVIILVNVLISAMTTLMIVRVLTIQPGPTAASAAGAAGSTAAPTALPIAATQGTATVSPEATSESAVTNATTASTSAQESQDAPTDAPTESPTREAESDQVAASEDTTSQSASSRGTSEPATTETDVRISAVLYPGQRQREVVVLVNEGGEVEMKDWTLSSSRNITYTFGNVTLFKDSFINLHTTTGADVPTDLFWNRTEPAWKSGDVLTLANKDKVIATYKVK